MKLLILSDIHGNWPALEAVLSAEAPWDAVAFCGDVVDYGPSPVECLRWVAENADFRVRGNHDNALAYGVDCRCLGEFRAASVATRAWHTAQLSTDDFVFLRSVPIIEWFEWGGRHFRMSHATPHGNLYEYLDPTQWDERVKGLVSDYVLMGHTHIQNIRRVGDVTVVNPGSVGQNRDGSGKACYAVYDGEDMSLKRVPYDVERTVAAIRSAPLAASVIQRLETVLRPQSNGLTSNDLT